MAVRADLKLLEGNDEVVREVIVDDDNGAPLNITGVTIEFLIKPNDLTSDDADTVTVLSTATGEIVRTDSAAGVCEVSIPVQQPGTYWRRLDVIAEDGRKTAIYGPMHVISV